jgi:methionyl-tRNA formyltransferase
MARIDWNRPAQELSWHLRGLDAVPGAWSTLSEEPYKLYSPDAHPRFAHASTPGTILESGDGDGLLVACGTGILGVGEVQPPGRKRMKSVDWLRGHSLQEGARFE